MSRILTGAVLVTVALLVAAFFWRGSASSAAHVPGADDDRGQAHTERPRSARSAADVVVSGRVVDDQGGVAGASVTLLRRGALVPQQVESDSTGAWSFSEVAPGEYLVGASAAQHVPSNLQYFAITDRDRGGVVLELARGGEAVTFVVTDAVGGPVADALLHVRDTSKPKAAAFATTDDEGRRVVDLGRGSYRVRVSHERYAPHETIVRVEGTRSVEIVLSPAGSVAGVVKLVGEEQTLANATVRFRQVGEAGAPPSRTPGSERMDGQIEADADGVFTIHGLPPGRFELTARDDTHTSPRAVLLYLELGEDRRDVVLEVETSATVRGKVVDDRTGAGVADARVFAQTQGAPEFVATSAEDGSFVATGVRPGRVTLLANHDGASSDFGGVALDVGSPEAALDDVVLRLEMGVMVSGRVDPPQAATIEVAAAELDHATLSAGRNTADDGTFTIGPVRPGALRLVGRTAEGLRGETEVDVGPEGARDLVIALGAGAGVSGRVVSDRGEAVGGARIVAEPQDGAQIELDGRLIGSESATAGEDGTFAIAGMAAGNYLLVVTNARGESLRPAGASVESGERGSSVVLADTEQRSVELVVQPSNGRIVGQVLTADGTPAVDVWVAASAIDNDLRLSRTRLGAGSKRTGGDHRVLTDAEGRFELDELAQKFRYRVDAWDQLGEGSATLRNVAPDATGTVQLTLQPFAKLAGRVVHEAKPQRGVAIVVSSGSTVEHATTDADGRFEIDALRPAEYSVRARAGELGATVRVTLAEGQLADEQIELAGRPHVRGQVTNGGEPVVGAEVSIIEPSATGYLEFGRGSNEARYVTDGEGRFDVPADAGEWTVVVSRPPHQAPPGTANVTVEAGEIGDVGVIEYAAQ